MLVRLSKHGCSIARQQLGAFMYADDLLLLSPSVHELQLMLNVCESELELLDLKLNAAKSACLRIGPRCAQPCYTLQSTSGAIPWVTEARYLGVYITCSRKFDYTPGERQLTRAPIDVDIDIIQSSVGRCSLELRLTRAPRRRVKTTMDL